MTRLDQLERDLAEFRRTHHEDGTPRLDTSIPHFPKLPTPAEHEASCWRVIERWLELDRGERSIVLMPSALSGWVCSIKQHTGPLFRGANRLDALAQAATWCAAELSDPQAMTITKG